MKHNRLLKILCVLLLLFTVSFFTVGCSNEDVNTLLFGKWGNSEGKNLFEYFGDKNGGGGCSKKKNNTVSDDPDEVECHIMLCDEKGNVIGDYRLKGRYSGDCLNAEHCALDKEGYRFIGWQTLDGQEIFNRIGYRNNVPLPLEAKLYPKYYSFEYKYVCETVGGAFADGATQIAYNYVYQENTLPVFPVPVHSDQTLSFDGWYNQDYSKQYTDGEGKLLFDSLDKAGLRADDTSTQIPLYAKYETKKYTLTFDYEGVAENRSTQVECTKPLAEVDLSEYMLDIQNKEVIDWTLADGSALPEYATADITLKAVWFNYVKLTLDFDERFPNVTKKLAKDSALSDFDLTEYYKEDGNMVITGFTTQNGGQLPENLTENLVLKAVWSAFRDVEFVYNIDDIRTVRLYAAADKHFDLPIPEIPGQRFGGWYDNPNYTGVKAERPVVLKEKYYAKWTDAVYTLTFVCDNGETFVPQTYYYGDEMELPTPTATKTGYKFGGWTETENGEGNAIYKITSDMYGDKTLYAKWQPETYEVTLSAGYGKLEEKTGKVQYEQGYVLPVPQRAGYNFQGWYSAVTGGTRYTDPKGNSILPWTETQGAEMYARYARKTYTVTYVTNGGSAVTAQKYEHGKPFAFPEAPTKAGYLFGGWFEQTLTDEYTEKETVRENVTLYAKWLETGIAISDVDGLKAIANNPSGNYYLTKDINLMGEDWTPIPEFSGTLDGKGHKIYAFMLICNVSVNVNYGFISNNNGTLKNIVFSEVDVTLTQNSRDAFIGVAVGANNGSLINCTVANDCKIKVNMQVGTAAAFVGGLVGYHTGVMNGCQSSAEIHSSTLSDSGYLHCEMGGLVGRISENGSAKNSSYTGKIDVPYIAVWGGGRTFNCCIGGFAGKVMGKTENCFANAQISLTYVNDTTYGHSIGGFVGQNDGTVNACYSVGKITGTLVNPTSGGFVGWNNGDIKDCYTSVETDVTLTKHPPVRVGGFVGENTKNIRNSYSLGNVTCGGETIAGFAGLNNATGVIARCFALGNVTNTYGNACAFVPSAKNSGTLTHCYYGDNVVLTKGTEVITPETVNGVAMETQETLLSAGFIYDKLYWEVGVWTANENGFALYWEAFGD